MNVVVLAVDKLREPYLRDGCALYLKRLAPYMRVSVVETRKASGAGAREVEAEDLLARLHRDDVVWALDGSGAMLSSEELAEQLGAVGRSGARRLVLAIGGPDGLSPRVIQRADLCWSLSRLTFLHEMARLVALEQLYRAAKIARDEPYHR